MNRKKLVSILMAIVLSVTAFSVGAFAEDAGFVDGNVKNYPSEVYDTSLDNVVTLSKTAKDLGNNEFEITLSIDGEGIEIPPQAEIALVIDRSNSMDDKDETNELNCGMEEHRHTSLTGSCYELTCTRKEHQHNWNCWWNGCDKEAHTHSSRCYKLTCETPAHTHKNSTCKVTDTRISQARASAKAFINELAAEYPTLQVGVVSFGTKASVHQEMVPVGSNLSSLLSAVSNVKTPKEAGIDQNGNGATNIDAGLQLADGLFNYNSAAKKIIIIISDGEPTKYGVSNVKGPGNSMDTDTKNATLATADGIKEKDTTIFSISFFTKKEILDDLATDDYYYSIKSGIALEAVLSGIGKTIIEMAPNAVIDPMGEMVDLISTPSGDGSMIYNAETRTIEWTPSKMKASMTYKVALRTEHADFVNDTFYPANKATTLSYSIDGEVADTVNFPIPEVKGVRKVEEPKELDITVVFKKELEGGGTEVIETKVYKLSDADVNLVEGDDLHDAKDFDGDVETNHPGEGYKVGASITSDADKGTEIAGDNRNFTVLYRLEKEVEGEKVPFTVIHEYYLNGDHEYGPFSKEQSAVLESTVDTADFRETRYDGKNYSHTGTKIVRMNPGYEDLLKEIEDLKKAYNGNVERIKELEEKIPLGTDTDAGGVAQEEYDLLVAELQELEAFQDAYPTELNALEEQLSKETLSGTTFVMDDDYVYIVYIDYNRTTNSGNNEREDDDTPSGRQDVSVYRSSSVEIQEPEVPLANIPDEEVPLAQLPKTGNGTRALFSITGSLWIMAGAMLIDTKKKKEDEE